MNERERIKKERKKEDVMNEKGRIKMKERRNE